MQKRYTPDQVAARYKVKPIERTVGGRVVTDWVVVSRITRRVLYGPEQGYAGAAKFRHDLIKAAEVAV